MALHSQQISFLILVALSLVWLVSMNGTLSSKYSIFDGQQRDSLQPANSTNEGHAKSTFLHVKESSSTVLPVVSNETSKNETLDQSTTVDFLLSGQKAQNSNVTIVMGNSRPDRLGAQAARPLNFMAWSQCNNYRFCIAEDSEGAVKPLKFPICTKSWMDARQNISGPLVPKKTKRFVEIDPNKEAVLIYKRKRDTPLDVALSSQLSCAFNTSLRQQWKSMILNADYSTESFHKSNFFTGDDDITTIAVHARRGDLSSRIRDYYVPDATFQGLIRKLRRMVEQMGKKPEVHLFSEDFGDVNWTGYKDLVNHFHFAPNLAGRHEMDVDLNIRDWKHFVRADILVINGSFSERPGIGRGDPDPQTGLPLTLMPCFWAVKRFRDQNCNQFPHFFAKFVFDDQEPSNITFRFLPPVLEKFVSEPS